MVHPLSILLCALGAEEPAALPAQSYAELIRSALDHVVMGELDAARADLDATNLALRGFEWAHASLAVELARTNVAAPGLTLRGAPSSAPTARVEPISQFFGHTSPVRALALAPSGDRLASGGEAREIRLWKTRTGDPERMLVGHGGAIVGLVFSKDGRRLASASADGDAILWDLADGLPALTFRASGDPLTALAWNASNEWLATADATLGVRVWNATNSDARLVVRGHSKPITSIAFSPNGKYLGSTSEDGSVRIVDANTGDPVRIFSGNGTGGTMLAFEQDNLHVRLTLLDGSMRRLDLASGTRVDATVPAGDLYWCLAQAPDATRIAIGSELGSVFVYDVNSKLVFSHRLGDAPIFAVAFDARTSRLFAAGSAGAISVFETDAALARTIQRASPTVLPDDEAAAEMKPLEIDALCRHVVERPGLARETYVRAESLIRAASDRSPGLGRVQSTLGAALYRQDRFDEALETLVEASDRHRGWPPNLAFRAMALARLERLDEARVLLDRLETLMREKRWEKAVEEHALLEEVRAVVATMKPASK